MVIDRSLTIKNFQFIQPTNIHSFEKELVRAANFTRSYFLCYDKPEMAKAM